MSELASQPTSIQTIYGWYADGKIFVNRRYQRKLVWTLEEKQRLIESILKKYPIPAVLIAEREADPGTYEIIDGLQRLHAIVSFIEGAFTSLDDKYFNVEHFTTANSRGQAGVFQKTDSTSLLDARQVGSFLDYSLALSVMRNASEAEVNDVFGRINTYGHRLSDQERRQAGVRNDFSEMVRNLACTLRGDSSSDILPLESMPAISIDLPMTKHGYEVKAEEVFWVQQGVLRSTDLRDSMDEQCIADIAACIIGPDLIERSKDALDELYDAESDASKQIITALEVYGQDNFSQEFKFCIDEILKVCMAGSPKKLRDIVFGNGTSNAFPSVFAVVLIAVHELIVKDGLAIADYQGVQTALLGLSSRIETTRRATSIAERRKNIDTIKGLISSNFVTKNIKKEIYGNHASTDIESVIRRSEIELPAYELKQGMLLLSEERNIDSDIVEKIIKTLAAISNNGPALQGKLLIGVTDKKSDADRVRVLDKIEPKKIGRRYVVGVAREAAAMGISMESYLGKWKDAITSSRLSEPLKSNIVSNIDFNDFYGLGVILFTVQPQRELSYVGEDVYWRDGDSTKKASSAKDIAAIAQRFSRQ